MIINVYEIETKMAETGEQIVEMRASMKTRVKTWTFIPIWPLFITRLYQKAWLFYIFSYKMVKLFRTIVLKIGQVIPSDQRTDIRGPEHFRWSWNCRGPKIKWKEMSPLTFSSRVRYRWPTLFAALLFAKYTHTAMECHSFSLIQSSIVGFGNCW